MSRSEILLDIDGPFACQNEGLLVQLYTQYFHLDIERKRLESITSVREFETFPEVLQFKKDVGTTKYEYLLQLIVYVPEHMKHSEVTNFSQEGVMKLDRYATIG